MKLALALLTLILFNGPALSTPIDHLNKEEQQNIKIFQETVRSVVNVSNIRVARSFWDRSSVEVPAGAGSGFVWDNKGHIVTNYHVINNGDSFLISFHKDKKQYKAKLVGGEPKKDIAVLKLEEMPTSIIPIAVGESKNLLVGQQAIAIGNPFGLDHTMTSGIISALERQIDGFGGVKIRGMIQTDASINPGNSGGPLLDSRGQLIGMNTMIFSKSGTSAGVGFAVPVDTVKKIVPQIIEHGKVIRPGIGIGVLPEGVKERFGVDKGIVVTHVDPNGPAGKAGIEGVKQDRYGRYYIGDIIISIDGKPVDSFDDIYHVLEGYKIGQTVRVEYIRDNKKKIANMKLSQLY